MMFLCVMSCVNLIATAVVIAWTVSKNKAYEDLTEAIDDHTCILEKPWSDGDLKYLKGSNIEHGEVKGEWV